MHRFALPLLLGLATPLFSQATPTASRAADVQVGIAYSIARPGYIRGTLPGIAAYADLDLRPHLGAEAEFHQVSDSSSGMAERTYELGARYRRTCGPLVPYAKGMFGLGQFQYPHGEPTRDYWLLAAAGGADLKLTERIHLRGEYEYQRWAGFIDGGLHPQIVTFGIAYHFPGTLRRR